MSLKIEGLSVVYHGETSSTHALDEVTLELTQGSCLGLVGESGSGKTTLGRACLGLLPGNAAMSGAISLHGNDIDYNNEALLNTIRWAKVAMAFQNSAASLNPVHRVIDQVTEPLIQRHGVPAKEAEQKAGDALTRLGLTFAEQRRFPHQLSGGQAQRVLLAMSLILNPEYLILDEPTSNLDAITKTLVADVIRGAKADGKGVLLITHDLDFAAAQADRVVVLYAGLIMETLPASCFLTAPLHPYTTALVGSYPAMNTTRDLGGIRGEALYRSAPREGGDNNICHFRNRCTQTVERCATHPVTLLERGEHRVRCLRGGVVNILELKGIAKHYGKIEALAATDLEIRAGEVFSLVGRTGSGKSTLAMIAAGALKQDRGRRLFDDRDMDEWSKRDYKSLARRIGVVFQSQADSISYRFTVFEAVAEPLRIHGLAQSSEQLVERVKQVLHAAQLPTREDFLQRYPHELNVGALQRIAMARALVLRPSLLVADEPTSALDPSVQAKFVKLLLDLRIEMGMSMLFVTHDIGLARKISDRVGVMLAGEMVEMGPSSLLLTQPAHPYTRFLLDSAAGTVRRAGGLAVRPPAPDGCPFYSHCPQAADSCARGKPEMKKGAHRSVACHLDQALMNESRGKRRK